MNQQQIIEDLAKSSQKLAATVQQMQRQLIDGFAMIGKRVNASLSLGKKKEGE